MNECTIKLGIDGVTTYFADSQFLTDRKYVYNINSRVLCSVHEK